MLDAWDAGDRARAVELVPEALVREIFLLGPIEEQRERLAEFGAPASTPGCSRSPRPRGDLQHLIDAFAPAR